MLSNKALGASRTTAPGPAPNFQNWTYSNPLAYKTSIKNIAYGNGVYVYVGGSSLLLAVGATSTDAITWTARTLSTTSVLESVTYGTVFVAVGDNGALITSTNGITWTSRTSGTTSDLKVAAYLNGLYLYGGIGPALATSTDAITWTARTPGGTAGINALTYGNGLYVLGANSGGIRTSTDAITWTARTSGVTDAIRGVAFGNGVYVFVTSAGGIRSSTDAITWTARTSGTTSSINSVTFSNNLFVVAGIGNYLRTSTNGTTYTERDPNAVAFGSITIGSDQEIKVSSGNNIYFYAQNNNIGTSTDGITWNSTLNKVAGTTSALAYGGNDGALI